MSTTCTICSNWDERVVSGDGTALYCEAVAVCHSGLSTVVFLMPSANQISTAIKFKSICKVVVFYKNK